MTPHKLPLEPFTAGDTWGGISSLTITVNGSPPPSPLSLVTMRFAAAGGSGQVVEISSSNSSQIVINSAESWQISVPEQVIPSLTAGRWQWRMRFTDAAGKKRTYLADEITVLTTI